MAKANRGSVLGRGYKLQLHVFFRKKSSIIVVPLHERTAKSKFVFMVKEEAGLSSRNKKWQVSVVLATHLVLGNLPGAAHSLPQK